MRYNSILMILLISLSCSSNYKIKENKIEQINIVNSSLTKELINIVKDDTLANFKDINKSPFIIVDFIKENDTCYLYIIPSPYFYDKNSYLGSTRINNYIISFYDDTNKECIYNLIDTIQVKKSREFDEYLKENTYLEEFGLSEPWGWKYRINNEDSLTLVERGIL